ncbi:LacI family DNA-binding transcriptional regulator [Actinoplanes lobatus]|uniref:DNA-binding LacI/PurR family transcriptional regulator n=2 Tax=Actinoplanes lobatus TaxID=113568 RepID=A0A7W7HNC5_9ACTN|nr:LacI family DNA-binding transcriptional regulator [Actinoplanes lobatus]MBB4753710.1 DNA-binding LacI/PurR family transcriptional regulator [Actinoplanes lobatus]
MTGKTRVTMRDVAAASGVSQATVSFVLNDAPGQTIPAATRDRVRRAAAELGYRPHSIARALREGASRIVVLEAGGLPRGHNLSSFIAGLDEELGAAGFGLLVAYGEGVSAQAAITAIEPRAVIDLPAVYAGPDRDVADGGWIDGMVAHRLVQLRHLMERGHRAIAVAVPADDDPFLALMAGQVRDAAGELGLPSPLPLVVDGDPEKPAGLLKAGVTAVAALTDDLALSVLAALADTGLSAPGDLAVIGFDDTPHGALWRPALTTVRLDARAYGRRTARTLLGLPIGDARPAPARVISRASA